MTPEDKGCIRPGLPEAFRLKDGITSGGFTTRGDALSGARAPHERTEVGATDPGETPAGRGGGGSSSLPDAKVDVKV